VAEGSLPGDDAAAVGADVAGAGGARANASDDRAYQAEQDHSEGQRWAIPREEDAEAGDGGSARPLGADIASLH
jgi:NAD/NADP transhydrogenase alpha subunit